jgi:hypothetical protein
MVFIVTAVALLSSSGIGYAIYETFVQRQPVRYHEFERRLRMLDDLETEDVEDIEESDDTNIVAFPAINLTDSERVQAAERSKLARKNLAKRQLLCGGDRYVINVVLRVKQKFGTPTLNNANRRVVESYATRLMIEDGHRTAHIARDIHRVFPLVFVPSRAEMIREEELACLAGQSRLMFNKRVKETSDGGGWLTVGLRRTFNRKSKRGGDAARLASADRTC